LGSKLGVVMAWCNFNFGNEETGFGFSIFDQMFMRPKPNRSYGILALYLNRLSRLPLGGIDTLGPFRQAHERQTSEEIKDFLGGTQACQTPKPFSLRRMPMSTSMY
jgi:hypothetical protein